MLIFQHPISPLAEQNATLRFNPITYGKNHIKVVKLDAALDGTPPFVLNL
jgi:hypothetical protein